MNDNIDPNEEVSEDQVSLEENGEKILGISVETEVSPGQLEFSEIDNGKGVFVPLREVLEAILFASPNPISLEQFEKVLKEYIDISKDELLKHLNLLKEDLNEKRRTYELMESFGGFQLRTRQEYSPWLKKFRQVLKKEKLSKSALETLSIIAYKQPITRAEVEEVRGVSVDNVMRVLMEKELIFVSGKKDIPGRPRLYSTTKNFLTQFGLKTIKELPPLGELNLN